MGRPSIAPKSGNLILRPLAKGPKLAGQRKQVLAELRASRRGFIEALGALGGPQITVANHLDQEARPSTVFQFIPANVPSEELKSHGLSNVLINRDYIAGCDCKVSCGARSGRTCLCISDKVWHFEDGDEPVTIAYTEDALVLDRILDYTLPIYECSEKCGCGPECINKTVMRGRTLELEVFKTSEKGWGVRCLAGIPKGTFVSCYRGELLDQAGSECRGRECDRLGETYLFDLDEWEDDLEAQNIPMLTIDAQHKGDISRFYNHSCKPNLKSLPVSNGTPQEYDVAFFSTRAIRPREELCFDYDPQWWQKQEEAAESGVKFTPLGRCACDEDGCRGWIFVR